MRGYLCAVQDASERASASEASAMFAPFVCRLALRTRWAHADSLRMVARKDAFAHRVFHVRLDHPGLPTTLF